MVLLRINLDNAIFTNGIFLILPLLVVCEGMIDPNPIRNVGAHIFGRRWAVAPAPRCIYIVIGLTKIYLLMLRQ